MNRFLTFAGTQPVFLGDIDFMQDAARQGMTLLLRSLANDGQESPNVILEGLTFSVPSVGQISWTAGVVALAGEILPIAAGTLSRQSTDVLYFHVVSTLSGSRTFKDGQTHECYETRAVTIDLDSTDGVEVASVPRLYHRPADVNLASDNVVGDFITVARLLRKDSMWSIRMNLVLASGTNSVTGSVTFGVANGVTQEIAASIRECTVLCPIVVFTPYTGTSYGFVQCRISTDVPNAIITLTLSNATDITLTGSSDGELSAVIPL